MSDALSTHSLRRDGNGDHPTSPPQRARRRGTALVQWLLWLGLATATPAVFAWTPSGPYGSQLLVQERGQRGQPPGRPSRDREEAQRRQGERERNNSMTPDERRELNRDLQRANREFYRKGRDGR